MAVQEDIDRQLASMIERSPAHIRRFAEAVGRAVVETEDELFQPAFEVQAAVIGALQVQGNDRIALLGAIQAFNPDIVTEADALARDPHYKQLEHGGLGFAEALEMLIQTQPEYDPESETLDSPFEIALAYAFAGQRRDVFGEVELPDDLTGIHFIATTGTLTKAETAVAVAPLLERAARACWSELRGGSYGSAVDQPFAKLRALFADEHREFLFGQNRGDLGRFAAVQLGTKAAERSKADDPVLRDALRILSCVSDAIAKTADMGWAESVADRSMETSNRRDFVPDQSIDLLLK